MVNTIRESKADAYIKFNSLRYLSFVNYKIKTKYILEQITNEINADCRINLIDLKQKLIEVNEQTDDNLFICLEKLAFVQGILCERFPHDFDVTEERAIVEHYLGGN